MVQAPENGSRIKMQKRKPREEDIRKFMQGCEDLMRLGSKFTENIRKALSDLKQTYDPALKSQYVDKAVVELLTRALQDFEKKMESNLEGIDKICTKGGKWFAFYLGRAVEQERGTTDTDSGAAHEIEKDPQQLAIRSQELTRSAGGS
jgi:hypothetical protein